MLKTTKTKDASISVRIDRGDLEILRAASAEQKYKRFSDWVRDLLIARAVALKKRK